MTAMSTTYSFDDGGATPVLWLHGEHDIATTPQVRDALARLVHGTASEVVVDLSDVTFLGAATIGVLVETSNGLARQHRSLALRSPSRSAWRLLRLCGLDRSHRVFSGGDEHPSHWCEPLAS